MEGDGSIAGFKMETVTTEGAGGKLDCDVEASLITAAAAAAAFVLWKLNLEAEGSLLLSQAVPLLCSLQQNADRCCRNRGVASQLKVMSAVKASHLFFVVAVVVYSDKSVTLIYPNNTGRMCSI